jgi:hypothetical protein
MPKPTVAKSMVNGGDGGISSSSWPEPTVADPTDNGGGGGIGHVSLKPTGY